MFLDEELASGTADKSILDPTSLARSSALMHTIPLTPCLILKPLI